MPPPPPSSKSVVASLHACCSSAAPASSQAASALRSSEMPASERSPALSCAPQQEAPSALQPDCSAAVMGSPPTTSSASRPPSGSVPTTTLRSRPPPPVCVLYPLPPPTPARPLLCPARVSLEHSPAPAAACLIPPVVCVSSAPQPRYWTPEEHRLFMEAVQRYGWKDVKSIAQVRALLCASRLIAPLSLIESERSTRTLIPLRRLWEHERQHRSEPMLRSSSCGSKRSQQVQDFHPTVEHARE